VRRRVASRHPYDDDSSALGQWDGTRLQVTDARFHAGSRDILDPTPLVVGIAGEWQDGVRNAAGLGDTNYKIAAGRVGKGRYIRQQFGVIGFFAPISRLLVVDIERFRSSRRHQAPHVRLGDPVQRNVEQRHPRRPLCPDVALRA
jgi:hypothetical protein